MIMENVNVEKATGVLMADLRAKYGAAVRNVMLNHVDAAGYWFSYELEQNSTRQTWCVRHWEVQ